MVHGQKNKSIISKDVGKKSTEAGKFSRNTKMTKKSEIFSPTSYRFLLNLSAPCFSFFPYCCACFYLESTFNAGKLRTTVWSDSFHNALVFFEALQIALKVVIWSVFFFLLALDVLYVSHLQLEA